jgi:hypothetical protein
MSARKKLRTNCMIRIYLFVLFTSVYLLTSSGVCLDSDASIARYELTRSIVESHDLSIPAGSGLSGADGRDYSWFGLGYSLFSVPFYLISKFLGTDTGYMISLINQLVGAATVILVFNFALILGYSRRSSFLTSVLYGFGTFAWPLTKQTFEHVLETFFVLLAIFLVQSYYRDRKIKLLLFSSFCLGFAFLTRPTSVLVIPAIFILMFLHYHREKGAKENIVDLIRMMCIFLAGFLPFLTIFFWYNFYRFGSIFESGYSLIASRTGIDFFVGTPFITGLAGFLVSPGKGFFYYSPVAVLFFFSIKSFRKQNPEIAACFFTIMLTYLFFLSKNIYWHGDWAWGPRYLLVVTPYVILPISGLLDSSSWDNKKVVKLGVYSLLVVSIVIQLAAVSFNCSKYFIYMYAEKKAKFTLVRAEGSPSICEPVPETYFDWRKSPILVQFGFIHDYLIKHDEDISVPEYHVKKGIRNVSIDDMNQIDFWWLYQYLLTHNTTVFVSAFLLLMLAIMSLFRIVKFI